MFGRGKTSGSITEADVIAALSTVNDPELHRDLVSLGTAFAFGMVCVSVLWLRKSRPDLHRPFRAPGEVAHGAPRVGASIAGMVRCLADARFRLSSAVPGDRLP